MAIGDVDQSGAWTTRAGGPRARPQRLVVVSGPKDGAGRTTLTAHLAVGLLRMGLDVGVVDLDLRNRGLTRWLARRGLRAGAIDPGLVMPASPVTSVGPPRDLTMAQADEAARWPSVLAAMGAACDTVIVDAPADGGDLARDVHADADVALTLVADSAADVDLLFEMGENGEETGRPGPYARAVWEARKRRVQRRGAPFDWVVARARALDAPAEAMLETRLNDAARLLGARIGPRLKERAAWRAGFAAGLTAFDAPHADSPGARAAAQEARDLLIVMKLAGLEGAALAF